MTFDAPPGLDAEAAAAFFFPFHLGYLGLFERGRLQAGETVLIHAAAGGVGSAAVQLAAAAGARVIATCGGQEKAAFCRQLGADAVVDYRSDDFVEAVDELTKGAGVDLVFDGVGLPEQSLRCLGYSGRYRIIGFSGGIEAEEQPFVTPRTLCFGNFSVGGVLLAYTHDPLATRQASGFNVTPRRIGEAIHASLLDLLSAGRVNPVVGAVVSLDEVPAALDAMEDRRTVGRTVVRWRG